MVPIFCISVTTLVKKKVILIFIHFMHVRICKLIACHIALTELGSVSLLET
jgi:hypothetical protein